MTRPRVYLDYNATAPLLGEARAAMAQALELCGNPSSVHAEGRAARAVIERARRRVGALCGVGPDRVVFASGASEAAATVLTPRYRMGSAELAVGRLYVSATEHPCVLAGGRFAPDRVTRVGVDGNGVVDLDELRARLAVHDRTAGPPQAAIHLANNETGVIQPVAEAAAVVHAHGGIMVVDAVQAAGRIDLDMSALGADFLLLSSHKIGGPKGAGAIVCADETPMPSPLIPGGGQERGRRAGTENPAAIAGFGEAITATRANLATGTREIGRRRDAIEAGIRRAAPDCAIHGTDATRLANTTLFSLPGLGAETAQIAFDLEGIAVSSGSACSSGKVGPSHVLAAMGANARLGAIRVSIGAATTDAEIERFLEVFARVNARREASVKKSPKRLPLPV